MTTVEPLPPQRTSTLTVNSLPTNLAPLASAGSSKEITLPASTVTLSGSGSDPEGKAITFAWTQISGAVVTLSNAGTKDLLVSNITFAGSYTFRLTVTR